MTSVSGVHEVADIEKLLANPNGTQTMLDALNPTRAAEMVNHFSAYLESAERVAYEEVVTELQRSCTKEKLEAASGRDFSRGRHIHCILSREKPGQGKSYRTFVC
ncbi:hypothetical protein AWB75_07102 [Caballeronia catudaia]|uniref:Uncharacterized protein n=1 Tax=Caballeronia catudaia TaxID=1777136 RepID=A0A158DRZ9_9BURK|nr:hypothetical protein [Caballeronia catudaia]SAK97283.1 hypothetical protein AWB75_07102 [Caballeronia catudaia]